MDQPDQMECPRCKGCGKVPLDLSLQQTLDWVRLNGDSTAADVHQGMSMVGGVTAACNRLKKLLDLHWLSRRKEGKQWVYMAIPF